jgi:hypothetical protein
VAGSPENPAPRLSAEDRIGELEARVGQLEASIRQLARRLAEGEMAPQEREAGADLAPPPSGTGVSPAASIFWSVLAQVAWTILALAGAFLVRAVTDRGAVRTGAGVTFGLVYAFGLVLLGERAAHRSRRLSAAFLGSTGLLVADAIVAETATRFGFFSVAGAMVLLAAFTAAGFIAARRHDLLVLAWAATLGASAAALAVAAASHAPAACGLFLLLVATASFWLSDGRSAWSLLPWPAALGADAASLWATSAAMPPPDPGQESGTPLAVALALGLPVLMIASALVRSGRRPRTLGGFEIVQTALALLVGFTGAVRLLRAAGGAGAGALEGIAVVAGAGIYAYSFLRRWEPAETAPRLYASCLGLALLLAGSALLFSGAACAILWSLAGVAGVAAARRIQSPLLALQGTVFAVGATLASGLVSRSMEAFIAATASLRPPEPAALLSLAGVALCALLLLLRAPAGSSPATFAAALVSAAGLGAFAIQELRPLLAGSPASLAALRTGVLSVSAFGLAWTARRTSRGELRILAYLALAAGGVKLILEDVPRGSPETLFAAFVFYGAALLLVPRLLRGAPAADRPPG